MCEGLREVMRDRECTLEGKGLIATWSDKQSQPSGWQSHGSSAAQICTAIRQVHRLVSEIPAPRKEFSLLLAKQSHLTSVIKMCQSFNHLLALMFILICCTSQSTMPDFSTVT